MLTKLPFLLLFFLLVSPARAEMANGCPDFDDPIVDIRPLISAPRFDTSLSLPQIRELSSYDTERFSSTQHETPVGLTAARLRLDSNFEVLTKSRPRDHVTCAQISRFTLTIGFDETTVYIAHELPYGSCSYQVVMDHEMKHVGVDQALVRSLVQTLTGVIRDAVRSIGVVHVSSPEAAQHALRDAVSQYMKGLGESMATLRQRHQEPVDSRDEYSRLSQSCGGELVRLTGRW